MESELEGGSDGGEALIDRAMQKFIDDGDVSMMTAAAEAWRQMTGIEPAIAKHADGIEIPAAFRTRAMCAMVSAQEDDGGALTAAAMWTSIVQDPEFETSTPPFKAAALSDLAVSWAAVHSDSQNSDALDRAIQRLEEALEIANSAQMPNTAVYVLGLVEQLVKRGELNGRDDDLKRAGGLIRQGFDRSRSLSEKGDVLKAAVHLAQTSSNSGCLVEVWKTLEHASRDTSFSVRTRNDLRVRLSTSARGRACGERVSNLCRTAESILTEAAEGLPLLDQVAQFIRDDLARIRGWRVSLECRGAE